MEPTLLGGIATIIAAIGGVVGAYKGGKASRNGEADKLDEVLENVRTFNLRQDGFSARLDGFSQRLDSFETRLPEVKN